jgi:RNA polymerase sigma factor (sigma-70 family)
MHEDLDLVALLLAGDEAVIGEVRGWIGSGLARYRRRLGADDEDLEQEVLLEIMESLAAGRFRSESRFETYVRSFVRFKCVDRLRSLGRRDFVQLDDDRMAADAPSPLDEVVQRERAALARRVFEALPASCRELWGMIADGMSYREMSQITGLSEGTIRVRVHRCRQSAWKTRDRLLVEDLQ